jgi:hypothetical protein
MARRGVGGFGPGRLLLIGAVACFVLELVGVKVEVDLIALGLALGFASFLF